MINSFCCSKTPIATNTNDCFVFSKIIYCVELLCFFEWCVLFSWVHLSFVFVFLYFCLYYNIDNCNHFAFVDCFDCFTTSCVLFCLLYAFVLHIYLCPTLLCCDVFILICLYLVCSLMILSMYSPIHHHWIVCYVVSSLLRYAGVWKNIFCIYSYTYLCYFASCISIFYLLFSELCWTVFYHAVFSTIQLVHVTSQRRIGVLTSYGVGAIVDCSTNRPVLVHT